MKCFTKCINKNEHKLTIRKKDNKERNGGAERYKEQRKGNKKMTSNFFPQGYKKNLHSTISLTL